MQCKCFSLIIQSGIVGDIFHCSDILPKIVTCQCQSKFFRHLSSDGTIAQPQYCLDFLIQYGPWKFQLNVSKIINSFQYHLITRVGHDITLEYLKQLVRAVRLIHCLLYVNFFRTWQISLLEMICDCDCGMVIFQR